MQHKLLKVKKSSVILSVLKAFLFLCCGLNSEPCACKVGLAFKSKNLKKVGQKKILTLGLASARP
jgi:hypothetical protein